MHLFRAIRRVLIMLAFTVSHSQVAIADGDLESTKALANRGDIEAQVKLGDIYDKGLGVKKDAALALTWYRKAADKGDVRAQYAVGMDYVLGDGAPKDEKTGFIWLSKAANQGYSKAQYNLGSLYYFGSGVTKDLKQALMWYTKSAQQGDVDALTAIAFIYSDNKSPLKDFEKAIYWNLKAAEQGSVDAQFNLGMIYFEIYSDAENGYLWSSLAAANHAKDAAEFRDKAATKLTPQTLTAARIKVDAMMKRGGAFNSGDSALMAQLNTDYAWMCDGYERWQFSANGGPFGDYTYVRTDAAVSGKVLEKKSGRFLIMDGDAITVFTGTAPMSVRVTSKGNEKLNFTTRTSSANCVKYTEPHQAADATRNGGGLPMDCSKEKTEGLTLEFHDDEICEYIDNASIIGTKTGTKQYWSLRDYKIPQEDEKVAYRSVKIRQEVSCADRKYKFLTKIQYKGKMGSGDIAGTKDYVDDPWEYAAPASLADSKLSVICGKNQDESVRSSSENGDPQQHSAYCEEFYTNCQRLSFKGRMGCYNRMRDKGCGGFITSF